MKKTTATKSKKKVVRNKIKKTAKIPAGFVALKSLKKGIYFKTRNSASCPVLVKGEYVREDGCNRYSCYYFNDVCKERFLKGETPVFIDFEF